MAEPGNKMINFEPGFNAEKSGVSGLKMGVWYNPEVPKDRAFGETLLKLCDSVGCETKLKGQDMSPEGILPGQDTAYAVERMFEGTDIVHVVMSKEAFTKGQGMYMKGLRGIYEAAQGKLPGSIFAIPIILDDVEMPMMFKGSYPLKMGEGNLQEAGKGLLRSWEAKAKSKAGGSNW